MSSIYKIIFLFLYLWVYNIVAGEIKNEINTVISLLESGKFSVVEEKIKNIEEPEVKYYLTALYYLFTGDYEQAEKFINKISTTTKIDEEEIKFYREYISKLNKIISTYNKFESEHFVVFLKGKDIILKDILLSKMEQIYKKYSKLLDYVLDTKVRIEVYNTKTEFMFCSTLGEKIVEKVGVVGICKFNRIMILSPENLPLGYRWIDTLAHEYIHFILNRITEFNLPLYLHEGIARYFDTLYRSTYPLCFTAGNLSLLVNAKKNSSIIPFHNLRGSLVYLDSQEQVEQAFVQLATFIDYLIKTFGEEKLIKFITSFKYNKDDKENYKKIYNSEFEILYSSWLDFIDEKESIVNQFPGAKPDIKIVQKEDEANLIGLTIKGYIDLSEKYALKKNYKMALHQCYKALEIEPYNPLLMVKTARYLMLQNKYEESENILLKCIKANPNYVTGYELLIKLYYETGMYEKAKEFYNTILEINPFNYEIRKLVAEMFADLKNIREALEEYKIVHILNPQDKETIEIINSLENYMKYKSEISK